MYFKMLNNKSTLGIKVYNVEVKNNINVCY